MATGEPETEQRTPDPIDCDAERIARENGISKEQVEQLARATDTDTKLSDAAGAAARWS